MAMSAEKLILDCAKQSELTNQLIALLEDEGLVEEAAQYGESEEHHVLQRYRAIDEYRERLRQRLLEGK
jgi:hypothetical protein